MLLLCVLLCSFSVYGESITAKALSGGSFLPVDSARAYFGDEIACTYHTSSGNVDTIFRYYGTTTFSDVPAYSGDVSFITGSTFLLYSADLTGIIADPTQITVDIKPEYSIFDTQQIRACIGLTGTNYSPQSFISASWDWYYDGERQHFEAPINEYGYGLRAQDRLLSWYNLVPVSMTSQNVTSGYSLRAVFPVADSSCYLALSCPYVSLGASGGSGAITDTTGLTTQQAGASDVVSGISETNDILEEHSGLLGDIIDFLHYIFDTLEGDESEVSEVEPIETMENPPDWDDAMSQVESALDDIPDVTASGGFIWALYNMIMTTSPVIKFLVPFGLIITLLSYIWWKK